MKLFIYLSKKAREKWTYKDMRRLVVVRSIRFVQDAERMRKESEL